MVDGVWKRAEAVEGKAKRQTTAFRPQLIFINIETLMKKTCVSGSNARFLTLTE